MQIGAARAPNVHPNPNALNDLAGKPAHDASPRDVARLENTGPDLTRDVTVASAREQELEALRQRITPAAEEAALTARRDVSVQDGGAIQIGVRARLASDGVASVGGAGGAGDRGSR